MKILWYNKNIDVLLNELKNHSISKKITKFILGGKSDEKNYERCTVIRYVRRHVTVMRK